MANPYHSNPFYSSSTPPLYSTNIPHTDSFPHYPWHIHPFYTTNTHIPPTSVNLDFHHGYTPPSPNPCPSYISHYPPYPSQQQTQPQPTYTYQHLPTPTIPPPSAPPPQSHPFSASYFPSYPYQQLPQPYSTPMRASPTQESSQRSANELFQASKKFTDEMIDKIRTIQEELQASHLSIKATIQEMRGTLANQPQKLHAILQKHLQEKNEKEDEVQKDEDLEELVEREPEEQRNGDEEKPDPDEFLTAKNFSHLAMITMPNASKGAQKFFETVASHRHTAITIVNLGKKFDDVKSQDTSALTKPFPPPKPPDRGLVTRPPSPPFDYHFLFGAASDPLSENKICVLIFEGSLAAGHKLPYLGSTKSDSCAPAINMASGSSSPLEHVNDTLGSIQESSAFCSSPPVIALSKSAKLASFDSPSIEAQYLIATH